MLPGENPVQVRIGCRVEFGQSMAGAREDPCGHRPFHVTEEARVATQPPHHYPGEEEPEERPPTPGVPVVFVKAPPVSQGTSGFQQLLDGAAAVD